MACVPCAKAALCLALGIENLIDGFEPADGSQGIVDQWLLEEKIDAGDQAKLVAHLEKLRASATNLKEWAALWGGL